MCLQVGVWWGKYFRLNKYFYPGSAGGDGAPVRLGDHGRAVRVRQPDAGHQEQRRDPQAVGRQVGEQPSVDTSHSSSNQTNG